MSVADLARQPWDITVQTGCCHSICESRWRWYDWRFVRLRMTFLSRYPIAGIEFCQ